ncbi:hypothetical protein MUP79_03385 [Candidatus Bathyarchaeota archaeon]|nr:hypothetical protein [Candidatus Bathyarchaeota archaeon]
MSKKKEVFGKGKFRHYKVVRSKSPQFPVGMDFLAKKPYPHFADKDCNDVECELLHWCDGHPKSRVEEEFNIGAIRDAVSKLAHSIAWYHRRGGLLPYDWRDYGEPHLQKLRQLCKLRWDEKLKIKSKDGVWR